MSIIKMKKGAQRYNKNAVKWTEESALELGYELIDWMKKKPYNIVLNEFLVEIKGLHKGTFTYLCTKYDSFSDLYENVETIRESRVKKYWMVGKIKDGYAKFMFLNNFGKNGWAERSEQKVFQEISGPDGGPIEGLDITFKDANDNGYTVKKTGTDKPAKKRKPSKPRSTKKT